VVLGRTYEGQDCSIARTLEVVGERWTLLVLRESFLGTARFDDFQRRLGIARNVLQTRLERLVEEGVLERRPYQDRPRRFEYVLTREGRDLLPVLLALLQWGDRHRAPDGPPVAIAHARCGGPINAALQCERCGVTVEMRSIAVEPRAPVTPRVPAA
jgi:DNA-binding HxlR family transcriptional regulator